MTDEQTFADYRSRLNIKDVLEDAGYTFYKRDGLRYPAYVRLGSDGKRISGDKYIVMPNKNCCFQPPTIKLYSVTSFIWEHPDLFKEYKYGMKESALVHKVCQRLLNIPVEHRSQDVHNPTVSSKPFDINDYKIDRFNPKDFESQKPFYAFFKSRGIDFATRCAFHHSFFLASKTAKDGSTYKNLSFPMYIPGQPDNSDWYRGTADAMYQNIDFLKRRHEPYVIISSGDCVYKLDFNRVLDFHIEKKSDITVVCKDMMYNDDVSRFGVVRMDDESRITEFDEKPIEASSNTISTGIYVIRRRQLIELLEAAAEENRFDFVNDILVRYKNVKKIYGYKINSYWNNIADIDAYFKTNMDFLRPDIRSYFFREEPTICSKVDDLPPAKFNPGSDISNSLVSSGCIINGSVEDSVLFKQVFVGKNTTVKNCVILNDVYIGDNVHLENCIVESRGTINPNTCYCGEDGVMIVKEKNVRYVI